jgi:uncharacterized membrane protein
MDSAISAASSAAIAKPVSVREQAPTARIASIDIVRGVVMLLMAIDHVRVYSAVPAGGPTPGIFFTRWVTHFVAPAFCFLAGTAAWLHGRKLGDRKALSWFLLTRGAWLILLELTVLRLAWTFNFDFKHYMLAGVIWMLGWCMVLLAGLIWLPVPVIATLGVTIIAAHNILDFYARQIGPALQSSNMGWPAQFLYFGGTVEVGGVPLAILYSIVPWIGVMATGYAYGALMELPVGRRRKLNLSLGLACIVLFVGLRALDVYGDPRPWNPKPRPPQATRQLAAPQAGATSANAAMPAQAAPPSRQPARPPAYIRFLNTTKYPASLLFLLMTLGPMFVALSISENWKGKIAGVLEVYGRVPMWYYLLHIPLIHVLAILVSLVRSPGATWWLFGNHPLWPPDPPGGYMWNLGLLYAVWLVAVVILYFPCRWFAELKARKKSRWLSYL